MKRPRLPKARVGAEEQSAEMTLGDHLRELRRRVIISAGAVVFFLIPAWFLYPWLTDRLASPYCRVLLEHRSDADCGFLALDPLEPLGIRLKVAGYGALILAMPVLMWQLWRFVAPGLYKKERRYAVWFTGSAVVLFSLGAWLAYWTLPQAVGWLVAIGGDNVITQYSLGRFTSLVILMMVAFGIGFEFPIVLVALQFAGVATPQWLAGYRRHAFVFIVVAVALLTPSGDPISLFALSVPMYLFYESSIVIGRIALHRRKRAELDPAA